jgi:long-chain fatty acid transport protein
MRLLLASVLLWPSAALAAGYSLPTQNPRDLALAQAAVAAQEGPAAVLANLAALAGPQGLAVFGAGQLIDNRTRWTDPTLGSSRTKDHPAWPPSLALSYGGMLPGERPYGVGLGLLLMGGGSMFWPEGWAGATRIAYVDQRSFQARGGGAVEVAKGLRLGAAAVFYRMTEELVQDVNYLSSVGRAQVGLAGNAWAYALSAQLDAPFAPVSLGVDYRHKGNMTLKGKAHFTGVPPAYQPSLQDQGARQDTTVPNELYLGLAWRVTPRLAVMGAWSLERWVVYGEDRFVGDKGFTVTVPRDYRNGWVWRAGAEYQAPAWAPALALRAGIQRSISDQPSATLSPTLSDASSWGFCLGAGYQLTPGLRADLGYMLAILDRVTASGLEAFPGSYTTTAHFLSVGVTWRSGPAAFPGR